MKKYYFQTTSIILLILSLIAFSDNLITDVGQESNSDPKFIIHGIFTLSWFIIFVVQTNFIRKGNINAHMSWGVAGMISGIGVFLSTLYVFIAIYKGWDVMPDFVKANRIFMLSFAILLVLGYLHRKNGAKHKRFIYLATLLILEPIIGRVSDKLQIENWELFYIVVWNGFFISLLIYDWINFKKIHKISWIGFVWFYIVWVFSILTST